MADQDGSVAAELQLAERMLLTAEDMHSAMSEGMQRRINQVPRESALHQLTVFMSSMPDSVRLPYLEMVRNGLRNEGVTPIGEAPCDVVDLTPQLPQARP